MSNKIREVSFDELRAIAKKVPKGKWLEIIAHHFSSPSAAAYRGLPTWNGVYNNHISRGFSDIGYHVGVDKHGKIWLLRHTDASGYRGALMAFGAHCVGHNARGLGVVLAGDFDHEDPKANGWDMLVNVVAMLAEVFGIPVSKIYPHSAFAAKSCPGKKFSMAEFRSDVEKAQSGVVEDVAPAVPDKAVVLNGEYATTDIIFQEGRAYVPIADFCDVVGWGVKFEKNANGLRWYLKPPGGN